MTIDCSAFQRVCFPRNGSKQGWLHHQRRAKVSKEEDDNEGSGPGELNTQFYK